MMLSVYPPLSVITDSAVMSVLLTDVICYGVGWEDFLDLTSFDLEDEKCTGSCLCHYPAFKQWNKTLEYIWFSSFSKKFTENEQRKTKKKITSGRKTGTWQTGDREWAAETDYTCLQGQAHYSPKHTWCPPWKKNRQLKQLHYEWTKCDKLVM